MLIISITLTIGTIAVLCFNALAGRLAGFSVIALWSAATAYFFMTPLFSLRVANARDVTALVLYGTIGIVLTRRSSAKRRYRHESEALAIAPPSPTLVDFEKVLSDLIRSSELGERIRQRQIEIEASNLREFQCSYVESVRILSDVFASVLIEPQLRRIVFQGARRPGVALLFVDAHRIWPLPLQGTIIIGKREEDCSRADFQNLPTYMTATWFDNKYGRIYQVSLRRIPLAGVDKHTQDDHPAVHSA